MVDEKYFYVIFIYNYLMFNVFMIIRVAVNIYIYTVHGWGQIPLSRNPPPTLCRIQIIIIIYTRMYYNYSRHNIKAVLR